MCQAVAEDEAARIAEGVDRHCEALFLNTGAQQKDDYLLFVRNRILKSEVELAAVLDLYGQLRAGKRVVDDVANPLVTVLRLSGLVKSVDWQLVVRNRIYAQVFDRGWVRSNMPDAELQRQRAAYRRGVLRAVGVSSLIVILIAFLVGAALVQKRLADANAPTC